MIMKLSLHTPTLISDIELYIHMIMKNTRLIWFINITVIIIIIIIVQQMSWTGSSQGRWRQRRRKLDALCLADNLIHYRDSVQFPPLRIVDDTIRINRLCSVNCPNKHKKVAVRQRGQADPSTEAIKNLRIFRFRNKKIM